MDADTAQYAANRPKHFGLYVSTFKDATDKDAGSMLWLNYPRDAVFTNHIADGNFCISDNGPGFLIGNKGAPCNATAVAGIPSLGLLPGECGAGRCSSMACTERTCICVVPSDLYQAPAVYVQGSTAS